MVIKKNKLDLKNILFLDDKKASLPFLYSNVAALIYPSFYVEVNKIKIEYQFSLIHLQDYKNNLRFHQNVVDKKFYNHIRFSFKKNRVYIN